MPTAHSTLTGANLHYNQGDSRSASAWTLQAGTTDALLIENSNGNDLLSITTSTTPGLTVVTLGNGTDLPQVEVQSTTFQIVCPDDQTVFSITAAGETPVRVESSSTTSHVLRLNNAWVRMAEVSGAPSFVAGSGYLYTRDDAGTTHLTFMRDDGTTVDLDSVSAGIGGSTGSTDNAVLTADGVGGATLQASPVTIGSTGAMAGVTDYQQTSGPLSWTGNGALTLGNNGTSTITVAPGSGGLNIDLLDNDAANLSIAQGSDEYIRVDTTNGSERLVLGTAIATQDTQIFAGNDASLSVGGDVDFQIASSAGSTTAFRIRDGASLTDVYLAVDTSAGVVAVGDQGITIPMSSNDIQMVHQGATAMPVHTWQRYRVTHSGSADDVLTYSVASGSALYVEVRAVWNRSSATTGAATATVFGGVWNDGGTTDEIGGATITGTALRSGQASTDAVNIQIVADDGSDELVIRLTKSGSSDYTVDLFVLVHATA